MTKETLVTCESIAAIVLHARVVTDTTPIKLGGHRHPPPRTLCGAAAAWDTRRPIEGVHCRDCIAELAKRGVVVTARKRGCD